LWIRVKGCDPSQSNSQGFGPTPHASAFTNGREGDLVRVLQIIPYFAPAWSYGGPPRAVYELSKALVRRGHSVTVLTTDAYSSTARIDSTREPTEVEVHYAPNLSNTLAWRCHTFLPIGTGRFLREHVTEFDILHVHMYRTLQNVIALKQSKWSKVPYVFSAHG